MTARKPGPHEQVLTFVTAPVLLASGDRVAGRFTVVEHYGAGPLGHTYRVKDPYGSALALKVIARELLPTHAERLAFIAGLRELLGRGLTRIAALVDAGVERDFAYYLSPWVPGRSLRRIAASYRDARREIPPDEVFGLLDGVIHGLRQLRALSPHGALYPESIQVTSDQRVILTDCGVTRALPRARFLEHFERYPEVMPYLAPEVRDGGAPTLDADLYSLGALASELLAGDPHSAAMGAAAPGRRALPHDVETAIWGLLSFQPDARAAAVPALLGTLAQIVTTPRLPDVEALPRQRATADLLPVAPIELVARAKRK